MPDIEVDLPGGLKLTLPEDKAKQLIAARDAEKAAARLVNDELATLKSKAEAATAAAAKAESEKAAIEAAKAGDIEKAKELISKESSTTISNLAGKYRDNALRAMVAANPGLLKLPEAEKQKGLVDDILSQLRGSCTFDLKADTLVITGPDGRPILGSDGKPKSADAFVSEFLEARPYLRQPTQSQGSGGSGSGKTGSATLITRKEYDPKNADQQRGLASGKIKFAD